MTTYEKLPYLDDEECRKAGADAVRYPLYRYIMCFTLVESVAAVFVLLYVELKHIPKTTFHPNFKILLIAYFANATIHAFAHGAGQVFLQLAVCCERTFATWFVQTYEGKSSSIGIALILIATLSPLLFEYLIYSWDAFEDTALSFLMVPPKSFRGFNTFFIVNMGLCVAGNALMLFLVVYNRRQDARVITLSSKYQVRENVITTRIAASLSILQMSIYILYSCSGVLLRTYQGTWFPNNYNLAIALRSSTYIIPSLTLLLPIVTICVFRTIRRSKDTQMRTMINLKSTGTEGWQNYNKMTALKWN